MKNTKKTVKKEDPANELLEALNTLARENKLDRDMLLDALKTAMEAAYKKNYEETNVKVEIDPMTGRISVQSNRTVVEDAYPDPYLEISLEKARELDPRYNVGDIVAVEENPRNFGRIAAQAAKQVIVQKVREATRSNVIREYTEKENEILTGIIDRVDDEGGVFVSLGKTMGYLEKAQQMDGESYIVGSHIKVYVLDVKNDVKSEHPVLVSRVHPGLVKRLFELEVPEIRDAQVLIKAIAREAGYRTKMAVTSSNPAIDPVGSCVGPKGMRVENVVNELHDEKIDIIKWSNDPAEFISNALNPAKVLYVQVTDEKSAKVIVPDNQLSLAIGKEGQNARLAAKLTGWRIDIKSQTQLDEEIANAAAAEALAAEAPAPEAEN